MGSIKRQKLLNFIWSLAFWKAHESNFSAEAAFWFSLPAMQIKVEVTGWCRVQPFMVWKHEDNSPKHTHELWQKEFKMGSVIVEYPLNLIAQNRKKNDKKVQEIHSRWKTTGCSMIEIINRKLLSQEIGQFLKYLQSENQSLQLFTRIAAFPFGNFFFINFLAVQTFSFTSHAFHITRKSLTVSINIYTHIILYSSYHPCAIWKICFELMNILRAAWHVILDICLVK